MRPSEQVAESYPLCVCASGQHNSRARSLQQNAAAAPTLRVSQPKSRGDTLFPTQTADCQSPLSPPKRHMLYTSAVRQLLGGR